jgi:hypothetical protein
MTFRGVCILALAMVCVAVSGRNLIRAQQAAAPAKDPNAEADDKILAEVRDHNEIMSNLEYLSDVIGARLTGSENLKKANDWTRQKFGDYGRAHMGSGHGERPNRQSGAASVDDCIVRLGAFDEWRGAGPGGLCESAIAGRSCSI